MAMNGNVIAEVAEGGDDLNFWDPNKQPTKPEYSIRWNSSGVGKAPAFRSFHSLLQ